MRDELLIDLRRTQLMAVDCNLDDARRALLRAARIPSVFAAELRAILATVAELERRGHRVEIGPDWSEGRLTAATRDGRRRRAAANPRGMQGYAAGR